MVQRVIIADCETFLIKPGRAVPTKVVTAYLVRHDDGHKESGLLPHYDRKLFRDKFHYFFDLIFNHDYILVNHNLAFDSCVISNFEPELFKLFFKMYREELAECTMMNQEVYDNARGRLKLNLNRKGWYTLANLAKKYLNIQMDKTTWRTGYGDLYNVPIEEWEEGARQYPLDDCDTTLKLYDHQMDIIAEDDLTSLPNARFQARSDFAFKLMSAWGIKTDKISVLNFENQVRIALEKAKIECQKKGFIREDGTKNLTVIRKYIEEHVENPPRTKPSKSYPEGQIATSKEILEEIGIKELVEFNGNQKNLSTYIPVLKTGFKHPINAFFQTLVETGRASCKRPNLMNLPRAPGVRECYIPRPGYLFCSVDYDTLELRTLAQSCIWLLGQSELAKALNDGLDPHLQLAANLMGISYEEALKRHKVEDEEVGHYRQLAKVANFGLPGGLGAEKFVTYAAGQGVEVTVHEAKELKNRWLTQWPEMRAYFRYISNLMGPDGLGDVILKNGFVRGRVSYTAACNFFFQALAAAGAKDALFNLQEASYVMEESPLFGSRAVCFIHDETVMEHPIEDAHERAFEQSKIMCDSMQKFLPDVKVSATPALMRKWYKKAKDVYNAEGKLVPWEPKHS